MSLLKSAVSSFEQDFAGYERQLHQCQKEIKEEIRLACIQRAYTEAIAQLGERKAAKGNRSKIEHFIDDTTNRNAQLSIEQAGNDLTPFRLLEENQLTAMKLLAGRDCLISSPTLTILNH